MMERIYTVDHTHCGIPRMTEVLAINELLAWIWVFRSYIIKPQLIDVRLSPVYGGVI